MTAPRRRLPKGVVSLESFRRRRAREVSAVERHDAALKELAKSVEKLAQEAKLFDEFSRLVDLSIGLQERGNLRGAEHALRTALAIVPGDPTALYNLGTVFEDEARELEAIACYEEALEADPNLADAHFNLGRLLSKSTNADLRYRSLGHLMTYKRLTGKRV